MNVIFSWIGSTFYLRLGALRAGLSRWSVGQKTKYTLGYVSWGDTSLIHFTMPGKPIRNHWALAIYKWQVRK